MMFKAGDRVRLIHTTDTHTRLVPGTEGEVQYGRRGGVMKYERLVYEVSEHVDEWHTTEDDGTRTCDFTSRCILDCFQGSTWDFATWAVGFSARVEAQGDKFARDWADEVPCNWCECQHWTDSRTDINGYRGRCSECYHDCPAIGACKGNRQRLV